MSQKPVTLRDVSEQYNRVRAEFSSESGVTLLCIAALQTHVVSGREVKPALALSLDLGVQRLSEDFFRHQPPTPAELENAIMLVEDQVARVRSLQDEKSLLISYYPALRDIAVASGLNGPAPLRLTCDAVEQCFERLAMISLGRPAAADSMPKSAEFAATLLILREWMHHLQFDAITLLDI